MMTFLKYGRNNFFLNWKKKPSGKKIRLIKLEFLHFVLYHILTINTMIRNSKINSILKQKERMTYSGMEEKMLIELTEKKKYLKNEVLMNFILAYESFFHFKALRKMELLFLSTFLSTEL